jgi:alpha-D-ribose 1-methylphosphonate 5-triphosphate diphosphatase
MIITNANIVTPENNFIGSLEFETDFMNISDSKHHGLGALDFEGDYLLPGFIELHTDNLEKHFVPRPKTFWPNKLSAALDNDRDIIGSGITTVYDAISIGSYTRAKNEIVHDVINAVDEGIKKNIFKADHFIHLRCELSDPDLLENIEKYSDNQNVHFASLMDHTPGQRQWQNKEKMIEFYKKDNVVISSGNIGIDEDLIRSNDIAMKAERENRPKVVDIWKSRKILMASHDDTTEDHVIEANDYGIKIAEFPTTMTAVKKAKDLKMTNILGAPNFIRNMSHSGNVSVTEIFQQNPYFVDALSSDYVPSSLLQAVFKLFNQGHSISKAVSYVTKNPALILSLEHLGEINEKKKSDFLRVALINNTPMIKEVYKSGKRVA